MISTTHKSKRVAKLLISVAFLAVISLRDLVYRLAGKKLPTYCVVLYYHSIPVEERHLFAAQMDKLIQLTTPISIESQPMMHPGIHYSAVTFDDAFENVIDNAIPELRTRRIPATLFVATGVLGKDAFWWPDGARERQARIASLEQLQQIPDDLISIGSHTVSHSRLVVLTESAARRELLRSRMSLTHLLNRKIATFSFPYGTFTEELVTWCHEAGYERVFTTLPALAFKSDGEFVVGRVPVEPGDWPLEFQLKVMGAYRWLPYVFTLKRAILSNVVLHNIILWKEKTFQQKLVTRRPTDL